VRQHRITADVLGWAVSVGNPALKDQAGGQLGYVGYVRTLERMPSTAGQDYDKLPCTDKTGTLRLAYDLQEAALPPPPPHP
jgi:hypothetical protein